MDRKAKLKFIKDNLSDKDLNLIYNKTKQNKQNKQNKLINKPVTFVDTSSKKYKVLLKFINKILVNIGKDEIDDLTEFKNVDRVDIIKPKNKPILDKMAPQLFKYFDKKKSGIYHKSPNVVHNVIRKLVKQLALGYSFEKSTIYYHHNNNLCERTLIAYTITNI